MTLTWFYLPFSSPRMILLVLVCSCGALHVASHLRNLLCLMLVLECILGLCSKQGDITCAFLHASLGKYEAVYIEMPQGFEQYDKNGKPNVLKLNRTLYGLRQSPRAF
jgi:hypothetical protein